MTDLAIVHSSRFWRISSGLLTVRMRSISSSGVDEGGVGQEPLQLCVAPRREDEPEAGDADAAAGEPPFADVVDHARHQIDVAAGLSLTQP